MYISKFEKINKMLQISDTSIVTRFYIELKNFQTEWTLSYKVAGWYFVRKWYFQNFKKLLIKFNCNQKNQWISNVEKKCLTRLFTGQLLGIIIIQNKFS